MKVFVFFTFWTMTLCFSSCNPTYNQLVKCVLNCSCFDDSIRMENIRKAVKNEDISLKDMDCIVNNTFANDKLFPMYLVYIEQIDTLNNAEFISLLKNRRMDLLEYAIYNDRVKNFSQYIYDAKKLLSEDEFAILYEQSSVLWNDFEINYRTKTSKIIEKKLNYKGKLIHTGQLLNGKRNGEWNWSYTNTLTPQIISSYKEGKLHGSFKRYFDNGTLGTNSNYVNGKLTGQAYLYSRKGKLLYSMNYSNNNLDGEYISFFENGNIESKGKYKNDLQHGKFFFFNSVGDTTSVKCFAEGIEISCPTVD